MDKILSSRPADPKFSVVIIKTEEQASEYVIFFAEQLSATPYYSPTDKELYIARRTVKSVFEDSQDFSRYFIIIKEGDKVVGSLEGRLIVDNSKAGLKSAFEESTVGLKFAALNWLFVDQQVRRGGLAKELFRNFREWATNNEVDVVVVDIKRENIESLTLFKSLGFVETEIFEPFADENGMVTLIYKFRSLEI